MTISKPVSVVFIGSFDLLTGIRLCHRWNYGNLLDEQIEEIVKISLSNVHRQEQNVFEKGTISTIDLQSYQSTIINIIFKLQQTTRHTSNAYISVGIILNTINIYENEKLNEIYIFWTRLLGSLIKNLIIEHNCAKKEISNIDFSPLNHIIDRLLYDSTYLFNSQIDTIPHLNISQNFDATFFSNALTSHLQTQMTTVIEFPIVNDLTNHHDSPTKSPYRRLSLNSEFSPRSEPLVCLLANFLLPFQRKLSSLSLLPHPINGLYLQCVSSQKNAPDEFLSNSIRPTTWIRLHDQKIFRTNERCFVDQYQNALHSTSMTADHLSNEENTSPYSLKSIKLIYTKKFKKDHSNLRTVTNSAPLTKEIVSKLYQSQKLLRNLFFEQNLNSLARQAFCLITIKNDKIGSNETLTIDQVQEIQKKDMEITNNDDFLIILSIAQIYDENTYKQMSAFLSNSSK